MKYILCLFIILFAFIMLIAHNNKKLKAENQILKSNQELLLFEKNSATAQNQQYKVADSLNAVKVSELQLSLDEYKKYKAQSAALIKELAGRENDLQKVIDTQANTIYTLQLKLEDSIRIDSVSLDTIKCIKYKSKWLDLSGCINPKNNTFENVKVCNRESLKMIETIRYKRFLGFLWKTHRIKSKQLHIVSENPATQITNVEYISLRDKQ